MREDQVLDGRLRDLPQSRYRISRRFLGRAGIDGDHELAADEEDQVRKIVSLGDVHAVGFT
jgi:hypothetical protein